ncbi:hypothetical protein EVAR_31216_1 [Eumeta japonica]|uniref:Uncharacterized protein n=1 Tax=Eumeta variegata TaxID=151549 RepID=A0A4C1VZT4_EUMVA|nr:hypothetical protein EVAR_31216_1 [Eumeta japonica]
MGANERPESGALCTGLRKVQVDALSVKCNHVCTSVAVQFGSFVVLTTDFSVLSVICAHTAKKRTLKLVEENEPRCLPGLPAVKISS